jgi:hypothetical protein
LDFFILQKTQKDFFSRSEINCIKAQKKNPYYIQVGIWVFFSLLCDQIMYNQIKKKMLRNEKKKTDDTDFSEIFPQDNLFWGSKSVYTQWRQVRITEGERLLILYSLFF